MPIATTIPLGVAAGGLESRITVNSEAIYKVLADIDGGPWLGAVDEVKPDGWASSGADKPSRPAPVNGLFNG